MIVIKKASSLETVPSILVWGDNGAGKSRFMGSIMEVPSLQPSVIIDCEPKGSQTIKDSYPDCNVIEFEDGKPAYLQFDEICKVIKENNVKAVGIDGASFLIDATISDYPEEVWKDGTRQPAYNKVYALIKKWYTHMETLCKCICTTCLAGPTRTKDGAIIGNRPLIPGNKFESIFFSLFNTVAYMSCKQTKCMKDNKPSMTAEYELTTKSGAFAFARTKAQAVYELNMKAPTMFKFYEKLMGQAPEEVKSEGVNSPKAEQKPTAQVTSNPFGPKN